MKKWIIVPNKKVGDIEFGMKRKTVREVIGEEYKEFKKNIFSKNTTDDYGEFHVYYNKVQYNIQFHLYNLPLLE